MLFFFIPNYNLYVFQNLCYFCIPNYYFLIRFTGRGTNCGIYPSVIHIKRITLKQSFNLHALSELITSQNTVMPGRMLYPRESMQSP